MPNESQLTLLTSEASGTTRLVSETISFILDEGGIWVPNASDGFEPMGSTIMVAITQNLVHNQRTLWPMPNDINSHDLNS